jgi:hypothetical protein
MAVVLGFSAFAIFLGIAAIGFFFLIFSLLFGEFLGHADLDGHDADFHGEIHGVSFFSTRVLSVFVTAFGGFGAIGIHLGYGVGASTGMGLAGGLFFGAIIYLFAAFLFSQQASSDVRQSDLVGKTAQVSVAIPRAGLGQVRCVLGENALEKIARSADGEEIPVNTSVTIQAIVGETCVVRRAE